MVSAARLRGRVHHPLGSPARALGIGVNSGDDWLPATGNEHLPQLRPRTRARAPHFAGAVRPSPARGSQEALPPGLLEPSRVTRPRPRPHPHSPASLRKGLGLSEPRVPRGLVGGRSPPVSGSRTSTGPLASPPTVTDVVLTQCPVGPVTGTQPRKCHGPQAEWPQPGRTQPHAGLQGRPRRPISGEGSRGRTQ